MYAWNVRTKDCCYYFFNLYFQVNNDSGEFMYCVDGFDTRISNWMRFVNSPITVCQQNLFAIQCKIILRYNTFIPFFIKMMATFSITHFEIYKPMKNFSSTMELAMPNIWALIQISLSDRQRWYRNLLSRNNYLLINSNLNFLFEQ